MYHIGDSVVYPMHGAGVIVSIEEHEVLGEKKKYYIMEMPIGDMRVMIPMDNLQQIGIRDVISTQKADEVLHALKDYKEEETANWNKRYRENMVRIKSGDIFEVSHVVKSLMHRDHEKGLSTGERKMLNSAKQILISELVMAKKLLQSEVEQLLEGICCK